MTGLFPREGTGGCSCVVLIYSDPFYSSLKVPFSFSINTIIFNDLLAGDSEHKSEKFFFVFNLPEKNNFLNMSLLKFDLIYF